MKIMDGMGHTLRAYREDDLEAIFRLDEICFPEEFRFDRDSMRAFAGARNAVTLVAEGSGGEVAGFVIMQLERRSGAVRGYVVTLDVSPEGRRNGLAARMMQEVEARAAAAGARRMELHVFTGNQGAIRFYERIGYERIEARLRFYGAEGLDAFVYRKDLAAL